MNLTEIFGDLEQSPSYHQIIRGKIEFSSQLLPLVLSFTHFSLS